MWVRIDDSFPGHRKVLRAASLLGGPHARARVAAVFLDILCYCNRYETGGFLSAEAARDMLHLDSSAINVIKTLTFSTVSLLHRVKGGWKVHDYDEYQKTSEQIARDRANSQKRQEKFRQKQKAAAKGHADVTPLLTPLRNAPVTLLRPGPFRPPLDQDQDPRGKPALRVLTKLAHDVLDELDAQAQTPHHGPLRSVAEIIDEIKTQAARAGLAYDGRAITKAYESAEFQRQRRRHRA